MNDLISRAEAIELKPEFLNPNVNRETKEQTAIDRAYARGWNSCNTHWIKEIIEDLPSAQQERKTGRWVERNPQNSPDCRLIECSECGNAYIVGYNIDYDDWIDGRNFCMKCGADLRGGNNGKNT